MTGTLSRLAISGGGAWREGGDGCEMSSGLAWAVSGDSTAFSGMSETLYKIGQLTSVWKCEKRGGNVQTTERNYRYIGSSHNKIKLFVKLRKSVGNIVVKSRRKMLMSGLITTALHRSS